jgi:hypothetical protein
MPCDCMSIWNSGTGYSRRRPCPAIAWPCAAAVVLLAYKSRRSSSSRQASRSGPRQISWQTPFPHLRQTAFIALHDSRKPEMFTCAPSYSRAKRKLANLARDSATEGMQLRILEQPPTKSISYTPDCKVVFLVIVTTSIRVSGEDWTVLMSASVFVCIFRPKSSVTHVLALAHFLSQPGPTWHLICPGFGGTRAAANWARH